MIEVFASESESVQPQEFRSVASAVATPSGRMRRVKLPDAEGASVGDASQHEAPTAGAAPEVVSRLAVAESREEIADAVLDAALHFAERAALFIVQSDRTIGWAARPEPPSGFRSFSIPFTELSLFATLRNTEGYYAGPVPALPGNARILEAIGVRPAASVVVVPVLLKQKTVLYLLGASPAGAPAPPVAELRRLATMTATALEIVLLRHRLRTL